MAETRMPPAKPMPEADPATLPFFEALSRQVLQVQRCKRCGTFQLGERRCNHCRSETLDWVAASGRASLYSFVVVHTAYHAAFPPPYNAAIVELEEGPRIYSNVIGCSDAQLRIDMPLHVVFEAQGGTWLPVFQPA